MGEIAWAAVRLSGANECQFALPIWPASAACAKRYRGRKLWEDEDREDDGAWRTRADEGAISNGSMWERNLED
jgi:hypothetical protein